MVNDLEHNIVTKSATRKVDEGDFEGSTSEGEKIR